MAYTEDDLKRVKAAIAKGEMSVQYGDKRVQYRSIPELQAAANLIAREINNITPRSRVVRLRHAGKGV
nr:MAG TPA: hypothetical protein [Caudoviricetes sp.]